MTNYAAGTPIKIAVAVGKATVTSEPKAITGLTYNGSAQALITAGEADKGMMKYVVGENGETMPAVSTTTESADT